MLPRVRWRPHLTALLLLALVLNNAEHCLGAPQFGHGSSKQLNPQGNQNPFFQPEGPFRVVSEVDDEFELHESHLGRRSGSAGFSQGQSSQQGLSNLGQASQQSFGVPLSATQPGHKSTSQQSFGVPLGAAQPGHKSTSQHSFGAPLGATQPGHKSTSQQSFGVPLSATQPGHKSTSQHSFGAPLGATQPGHKSTSQQSFGVPLSATQPGHKSTSQATFSSGDTTSRKSQSSFVVRAHDFEDQNERESFGRSHFSIPTHSSRSNNQRDRGLFSINTDDASFEDNVSEELTSEFMSLGRRFHPEGIPRRSDPTPTNFGSSQPSNALISNPFILKSNLITRDSLEDDRDDDDDNDDNYVVLSPSVKLHNHKIHGERLSLSNDFMSQYNFVDVKGSINWGYKTDDQYQEHQVHRDGVMEGKFGWTAPEGSQVNIKYIADEGGYRVLSSSGTYLSDSEEVRLQKERHFAEHAKAKAHHTSIKGSRGNERVGIPLPPTSGGSRDRTPGSGAGVVIVRDEDEFPLVGGIPGGAGFNGQGKFGVPLPDPGVTLQPSDPSAPSSGQTFGVPLPDPSVTLQSDDPSVPSSGQGFGIPLSDPSVTLQSGDPSAPPSGQGFGVSLPDPSVTLQSGDPSVPSSGQGFGIPLPDPGVTLQSGDPSAPPSSGQEFGIPLSGPTANPGESLPPPNQGFGTSLSEPSGHSFDDGIGIPLSGSSLPSTPDQGFGGSFSDQGSGVPLPDSSLPSSPNQGFDPSGNEGFGVAPVDPSSPSLPADQDFGIPLLGPSASPPSEQGSGTSSSDQGFGISLSDASSPSLSNQGSEKQDFGSSLPDRSASSPPSDQGFGIPLFGQEIDPSQSGSGFGVSLGGASSPTHPESNTQSGQNFGSPISGPGTVDSGLGGIDPCLNGKLHPSLLPPECFEGVDLGGSNQDFGIPLGGIDQPSSTANQDSFGIQLSPSDPNLSPSSTGNGFGLEPIPNPDNTILPGEQSDNIPDFGIGSSTSFSSGGHSGSQINGAHDQSFGIPLDSGFGIQPESAGVSEHHGSSNTFVIPNEDDLAAGISRQPTAVNIENGKINGERIQTEGGFSSSGVRESGSSVVFSNNDENFDPTSVGIPLSSQNSFGLNQENSQSIPNQDKNSFGVSLFDSLDRQSQSANRDLLQGPPVDNLSPSGIDGTLDFNPCLNSKIHPSLLPPECFDRGVNSEPDQRIGKSLSQTNSPNEAHDSFIVVVNSDIFQ